MVPDVTVADVDEGSKDEEMTPPGRCSPGAAVDAKLN
jgi:hypothetical protein